MNSIRTTYLTLFLLLCAPFLLFAQELRLVEGSKTEIDAALYSAYYGKLTGEPHVFSFKAPHNAFPVKAVVLVPDTENARTDISASMIESRYPDDVFLMIDGTAIEWQRFYDTAGRDSYLAGPVLEVAVPEGTYDIRISSPQNDSPYVLIMQGNDKLSFSQITSRFNVLPTVKSEFFGKSALDALNTPLLLWPIFSTLVLLGIVLLLVIIVRRTSTSSKAQPFVGRT